MSGGFLDRAASDKVRVRQAIQKLVAQTRTGQLITLSDSGGLTYTGDPATLTIDLRDSPPPCLELVETGLGVLVLPTAPFSQNTGGLGLITTAPITVSSSSVTLTLAATPGLEVSGGGLRVQAGDGIERTAGGTAVRISGTNPGLEFDGGGAIKAQTASTRGLNIVGSGLVLDIQDLASSASADDADTIAIYDATASAHRKQTRADFLTGVSGIPTGAIMALYGTTPPSGWLIINGDTIGNTGSGATHTGPELEALFNMVKLVTPNAGTESFAGGDTVALVDNRARVIVGLAATGTFNTIGAAVGNGDHVHTLNVGLNPRIDDSMGSIDATWYPETNRVPNYQPSRTWPWMVKI